MDTTESNSTSINILSQEKIVESTDEDKEREIYFMVLILKEEIKETSNELNFTSEIEPEIIYEKEIEKENGSVFECKVFKFKVKKKEANENEILYTIEYLIGNDIYTIRFNNKDNSFIYDIDLKKRDYYFDNIVPLNIDQNVIPLYNKLEVFLEALEKNNETNKIEKLFEEAVGLYKLKKKFNLLIYLFLHIYEKENLRSKLFSKLLATFKEIKGIENPNIDTYLARDIESINKIYSNGEIVEMNKYDLISFYGIILCYLNFYDTNDNYFSTSINQLHQKNNKVLYEILSMFHSYFLRTLKLDLEFFINYIGYVIENKDVQTFEKDLKYIKDIETFVSVINEHKEKILKKYNAIKPITIKSELKLLKKKNKKSKKNELDTIISLIEEIIDHSNANKKLLVYFTSEFWINLLKQYNKPDIENIDNCYKLRILFKKYRNFIKDLFKDNDKSENKEDKKKDNKDNSKETIKSDIEMYYKRDEFTFDLNKNIIEYLKQNELSNDKRLGIIEKYNPYFNVKDKDDEKKYSHKREVSIFGCIDFDQTNETFTKTFHKLNFENIFKKNISEFLNKIISKIKNIANFGTVLELIDKERLQDDKIKKEYYDLLKKKYEEDYIKKEIESIKEENELKKAIVILSKFVSEIYLFEKNCDFLDQKISNLDNRIKSLIYTELMKTYKGKDYEIMKDNIFQLFLKKLDKVENIIQLIDSLTNTEDKTKFLKKLIKECIFKKEDFYSNNENKRINLLCNLNEKGKLDSDYCKECKELIYILDDIYKDLESNSFTKNTLEEFLGGEENNEKIIKKLGLIKIVINGYDPKYEYEKLNNKIKEMNNTIKELDEIKNSFSIFHRNKFKEEIKQIVNLINEIKINQINKYDEKNTQDSIKYLLENKQLSQDINYYKGLSIFKIIFDNTTGLDQEQRYYKAKEKLNDIKLLFKDNTNIEEIYQQNEKIFNKIKDELSKKEESKSKEFIKQMINYFNIEEKYQEDLEIIFKSKKYEMDIKSIQYFFDTFHSNTLNFSELDLSTMNLQQLKETLKKIQTIYNYKSPENYYKIFTSLYEKKEAIDFLYKKIQAGSDIDYLKDKLDPTKRKLTIKNIEDTIECLKELREMMKEKDMLNYIKTLEDDKIQKFVNYSKIYHAIIELDRMEDNDEEDTFKIVDKIITKARFIFKQDEEDFFYTVNEKNNTTYMEDLIHIKNQISIQSKNNEGKSEDKKKKGEKKDQFEIKCDKLLFFKNLVYHLEIIYEKMNNLRIKGCNLPILINIKIEYPNVVYYLNQEETEFNDLRKFLLTAKNDYESQLNKIYKNEKYLRFFYGKIFRKIQDHLDGNSEIQEIIRYILNIIDNNKTIKDGKIYNESGPKDYVNYCSEYNKKTFDNFSKYIISLFQNNDNQDLDIHYEKMLIKDKEIKDKEKDIIDKKEKEKGIYLRKCKNISKEEYILYLFLDKLGQLPIAQNLLICNKETSIEEIQSFFYRAILCD